ncbi:hypothetical protein A4U94_01195 [Prescottella equi]|uniref:hypothetical protein n=1 Tax=Rhodococcus hoagii TaxID=43767 RepID=UPI0009C14B59|nr:hypothetical protein [Prescottella equi]OQQ28691.1 hypothetical protein A4U94_01195 [Prescottella equi]
MNLSEFRKAIVAVLGAITAIVPQVLATGAGVIPQTVAMWLTVIASTATAILVYLLPNSPKDPAAKVRASLDALGPVAEMIRERVQREVAKRLPPGEVHPTLLASGGTAPEAHSDSDADPLVVPPLGR